LKTWTARVALVALVALAVLGWGAGVGRTQGKVGNRSISGPTIPIVSTSDVIGYTAPCG
jgi:hypothetical protein